MKILVPHMCAAFQSMTTPMHAVVLRLASQDRTHGYIYIFFDWFCATRRTTTLSLLYRKKSELYHVFSLVQMVDKHSFIFKAHAQHW